jgi:hypothetical protein
LKYYLKTVKNKKECAADNLRSEDMDKGKSKEQVAFPSTLLYTLLN